jgi:hypothetical protein
MEQTISQNELIRAHLEQGNAITPIEALSRFGCLRLGARIHNLKASGMTIYSRIVRGENGKHFAEYSTRQPSELHASDRYAIADQITETLAARK